MQWDTGAFPAPAELLADVHRSGMRACLWINPYIGAQSPCSSLGRPSRALAL